MIIKPNYTLTNMRTACDPLQYKKIIKKIWKIKLQNGFYYILTVNVFKGLSFNFNFCL